MGQQGFFVDATRCIKCYACEVACQQWHELAAGTHKRRVVHEYRAGMFPLVQREFFSLACMHCEKPACVGVCPAGAIAKRADDGLVVGDPRLCIGCRSCLLACPFDVPRYKGERRIMDKCDGCLSLGRKPEEEPHCVVSCPTRALHFGDLEEMARLAAAKGGQRMEGATGPSVYVARRHRDVGEERT